MTKTLTEQWREGTLPEDCYYILTKDGHIRKERTCFYSYTEEQCFCFMSNKDIEEVLSAVPSYNEYKRLQKQLKEAVDFIEELSNACDLEGILYPEQRKKLEEIEKWGVK